MIRQREQPISKGSPHELGLDEEHAFAMHAPCETPDGHTVVLKTLTIVPAKCIDVV